MDSSFPVLDLLFAAIDCLIEVVVYFDQFVIGISQCHHKSEEGRPKLGVPSSTTSHL